jgi:DNA invertase Pin-like site-specific DNA recombinase
VIGVFAEFERAMILERVRAGLVRAKEKALREALRDTSIGIRKLAAKHGVGVGTVMRIKEAMRAAT